MKAGHTFVLTLQSSYDDKRTLRALRWLLKELCRQHKLTCIDIKEISEQTREVKEEA